jgi:uncharacterized lipoprotein YddW (UPF0748 family)
MRINLQHYFLILIFLTTIVFGQAKRETRAVWVTTNFKLDWPPNTTDAENQKRSLRDIFQNLKSKNFNTVYFQVRSNGTVMYNSKIEPSSPYLTGEVGGTPNYDPLQYALELGKEFNLEVHAWVNMMRCFSGSDDEFLKHPRHIRNAHPDWTVRVMGENGRLSYWMNPGYFRAQDYLVDILLEITSNYDVDGIHLDFFRYPDKKFEDDKYFKTYGLNVSLSDWRRNNLTTILRKFKDKATPINPYLKVGATPIGIRKSLNGANGWEGYSSVFQDTEKWLEEELVDYLTPQIYWNFERNPKFDILAKDWVKKSYNRNIILGLAAYKKDVKPELQKMIHFSREIGAAGISFFRYDNISSKSDEYFNNIAFPTNMPWKEDEKSREIEDIFSSYRHLSDNEILVGWNDKNKNISNEFRNYVLLNETKPIKFLSLTKNKVKLKFGNPSKLMYGYQICKLDRLWNYSSVSNLLKLEVHFLSELKNASGLNTSLVIYKHNENLSFLSITSYYNQTVLLDIISKENLIKQQLLTLKMGLNIIPIDENFKLIRTLRVTYGDSNRQEELNFY